MRKNFSKIVLLVLVLLFSFSTLSFAEEDELTPEQRKQRIIKEYFTDRELDPVEGFWTYSNFELAIVKETNDEGEVFYQGLILNKQKSRAWKMGSVLLWFDKTASDTIYTGAWKYTDRKFYNTTFEMRDHNIIYVYHSDGDRGTLVRREEVNPKPKEAGSGTGFFITPTLIATNHHVIEDSKEIEITLSSGVAISVIVVAQDPANDLAILKLPSFASLNPLPIGKTMEVKSGEKVYTIGHPLGDALGQAAKVSEGIVNSAVGLNNDIRAFQISIPIQPGNSGGPMFNSKGEVVGITSSGLDVNVAQNVNFAVKTDYLQLLFNSIGSSETLTFGNNQQPLDAAQIMALYEMSVVKVTTKK